MNIYLSDESSASFIVDATLSNIVGQPYCNDLPGGSNNASNSEIHISITRTDTGAAIIPSSAVTLNSTAHEFSFSLTGFKPTTTPYQISIKASTPCGKSFNQKQELYVLPPRTDGGSVAKVDYLYGGLLYQASSNDSWTQVFPYSFFVDWGGYLAGSAASVSAYAALGFNMIHPTPGAGDTPFDETEFDAFVDQIESEGVYLMYDMRWTYQNPELIASQVNRLKTRKSILLWYTADEPDGSADPLNATSVAYNQIKQLDPYHPTSLVLNCYNFYYQDYTSGADIVLTDPYPIATNVTFSSRYGTVCNTTYGCCGCDDCKGSLLDISERMDLMHQYETIVGGSANGRNPKSFWGVPQVFGASEFWTRAPTTQEEAVMVMLFINHNGKGIVGWTFPTTNDLQNITGQLAKTLTSKQVTSFLLGAQTQALTVDGNNQLDAAGWIVGDKMLVSIVNSGYDDVQAKTTVHLPGKATSVQQIWSLAQTNPWTISSNTLVKAQTSGLEVSIMVMDLVDVTNSTSTSSGTATSSSAKPSRAGRTKVPRLLGLAAAFIIPHLFRLLAV